MENLIRRRLNMSHVRYTDGGFDLDLTYILPNVIAMVYPAEGFESTYHNNIHDVTRFLDERHTDRYFVINLCMEKSYGADKFHGRSTRFPIVDLSPPTWKMMLPFCQQVDRWLSSHPSAVIVIHCNAGIGRTGMMICAYLIYKGLFNNVESAFNFFHSKRIVNNQITTNPCQHEYVRYLHQLLTTSGGSPTSAYRPTDLLLWAVELGPSSNFENGFSERLFFTMHQTDATPFKSDVYDSCSSSRNEYTRGTVLMTLPSPAMCSGDVRFTLGMGLEKTELFHFIFNTFFVTESESNDVTPNQEIINKRSECKHAKLRRPCKRNCPQFGQREFTPAETTPSSLTERCLVSVLNVSSPSADRTFNSQPDKSRIAQQRTLTLRWYNLELKNWKQWTSDLQVKLFFTTM